MDHFRPRGPARPRFVRLEWSSTDGMRAVTIAGALGLAAAVGMAIFGLPAVDLHGPLHRAGIMDPLCGGTRAARLTAQGHLGAAWNYNPLGILATLVAAASVARLTVGNATRRWLNLSLAWTPRRTRLMLVIFAIATIALEIRQQGRADLLLKPL